MGPGHRGVSITVNRYLMPGRVALERCGKVVWMGPLSDPWEDVDYDKILLSTQDYEATKMRTLPDGRVIP